MTIFQTPLDHTTVLIGPDEHAKMTRPGPWPCCDYQCIPGVPVYAIADGVIPGAYEDDFDGGVKGGSRFSMKTTAKVNGKMVQAFYAHVNLPDRKRREVRAGEQIGTTSSHTLHFAVTHRAVLDRINAG